MMMKMLLLSLIILVILNKHEDTAWDIEIGAFQDTANDQEISWNDCKVILNEHEDTACEIEIIALDTARDQEIILFEYFLINCLNLLLELRSWGKKL